MTSINNIDAIDRILKMLVFELNTESLGRVRCGDITGVIRDYVIGEFKETEALDGATFVRGLLSRLGRRIEEGQETSNNTKIGTPLSETDIQSLSDTEIESFAHEIVVHHTWLFKSFETAMGSVQTEEKCEHVSSDKRKNVDFPKNDGELDSDYLVRVFARYITGYKTEMDRHMNSLFKSFAFSKATQHWQDMIDLVGTTSRRFTDLINMHSIGLTKLKSMHHLGATNLYMEQIANQLTRSLRSIAGINLDGFHRSIALPEFAVPQLPNSIIDVTAALGKLGESTSTYSNNTRLPRFVMPGATREAFLTGYAVEALDISDEVSAEQDSSKIQLAAKIEETTNCIFLLEEVDPDLEKAYAGAFDAQRGTNPDRARHILTSLRELWDHLLQKIAPCKHVREWIPKDTDELLDDDRKPTRRARVLFVCRDLNHDPLTDFIVKDTDAFIAYYKVLNRLHDLESRLSEKQLSALLLRTNSWLTFILHIWKESQK